MKASTKDTGTAVECALLHQHPFNKFKRFERFYLWGLKVKQHLLEMPLIFRSFNGCWAWDDNVGRHDYDELLVHVRTTS
jgi:hypothetical protein